MMCAQRPEVRVKRMADQSVEIVRIAEPFVIPNENRVDVEYTIYATDIATGKYKPSRKFILCVIFTSGARHIVGISWFCAN